MDVTVRKLTGQEIETALTLAWEVFQEFEAPDYSDQGVKEFYHSIQQPHWLSLLQMVGAYEQDKLVGIIATRNCGSHIALLFVKGSYHKMGIGRKLFEALLKDSPTDTITVNASPFAVAVYHKLGFQDSDKEQVFNGIRYIPMRMHRSCP